MDQYDIVSDGRLELIATIDHPDSSESTAMACELLRRRSQDALHAAAVKVAETFLACWGSRDSLAQTDETARLTHAPWYCWPWPQQHAMLDAVEAHRREAEARTNQAGAAGLPPDGSREAPKAAEAARDATAPAVPAPFPAARPGEQEGGHG